METIDLGEEGFQHFGKLFLDRYLAHGFGSMSKSEMDTYIFHLLSQNEALGATNYEMATALKVTETRVKTLRMNAALRHGDTNHKSVIHNLALKFSKKMGSSLDFEAGKVSLIVEDPVEKRELIFALKQAGHVHDTSFNRELVVISPLALAEVVLNCFEEESRRDVVKELVQKTIADEAEQRRLIQSAKTLPQKIAEVAKCAGNHPSVILQLAAGLVRI